MAEIAKAMAQHYDDFLERIDGWIYSRNNFFAALKPAG